VKISLTFKIGVYVYRYWNSLPRLDCSRRRPEICKRMSSTESFSSKLYSLIDSDFNGNIDRP
jgi:hypothetical protein